MPRTKTKRCSKCARRRAVAYFYKSAQTRDKLSGWCKTCHIDGIARARERPESFFRKCVHTIRQRSGPSSLTGDDLLQIWHAQGGKCALTGVRMTFHQGRGRVRDNCSVDRIDPRKGYTRANIQLVTDRANRAKTDFTHTEFLAFCRKVLQNHEHKRSR